MNNLTEFLLKNKFKLISMPYFTYYERNLTDLIKLIVSNDKGCIQIELHDYNKVLGYSKTFYPANNIIKQKELQQQLQNIIDFFNFCQFH